MSDPQRGELPGVLASEECPPKKKITIRGLPVLSGEVLSADSHVFQSLRTADDFVHLASRLRGQFCLLIEEGRRIAAITDFGCSRPVFFLRDPKTSQYRVSPRLVDLVPFSRKRLRKEALFFYAARGGVGISPFYADIDEVLPATVAFFEDGRMESRTYIDWQCFLETRPVDPAAAEQRFIEIASGYLSAVVKGSGQIGCLLSSGTDSALIAWLLRQLGTPTLCLTADYSWEKYSEFSSAATTARTVGLAHERVPVTGSKRRQAFHALNGSQQNAPCCDGLSPILHEIASAANNHGISTLVTGDHADSLFLGFDRFFRAFPRQSKDYLEATAALSPSGKLTHLHPKPNPDPNYRDLLAAFGCSVKECLDWQEAIYDEDCRRVSQWTKTAPLHMLQQLGGQMWAGISWQNLFLPVTQAFDETIEFVSPFYDLDMIKFALSLPLEYKFRDGDTKVLLRDILARTIGRTVGKRASPNPSRIWRLTPGRRERSLQGAALRPAYDRAFLRNLLQKGNAWHELDQLAALGIWLSAQPAGVSFR